MQKLPPNIVVIFCRKLFLVSDLSRALKNSTCSCWPQCVSCIDIEKIYLGLKHWPVKFCSQTHLCWTASSGWTSLKRTDFLKRNMGTRPWSRMPLEGLVLINITLDNSVNNSRRLSNNFSSFNQVYAWFNNAQNCIFWLSMLQKFSAVFWLSMLQKFCLYTVRKSSLWKARMT